MSEKRATKDRRADALDAVLDVLGKVRKRMPLVDQRMDDMATGFPTGGQGGTEVLDEEAFEYQSSTEANALNPKRDVVGPDRRRRDQLLQQITKAVSELDDIDRKYLGGADGVKPPDPPGCEVIGRVKTKSGKRYWEPVYRHTDGVAFLADPAAEFNHGESIAVGQWAYDFGRRVGRWPYRAEIEKHMRGEDVRAEPVENTRAKAKKRGWLRTAVA